jgi:AcrR family transcriptional regulator
MTTIPRVSKRRAAASQPRWRRRKDARPAEIVTATAEVFAERGYAAARLDDVAHRAGVTKGTVYLYFKNKEELFKAIVREAVLPNVAEIEAMLPSYSGSVADLLRGVVPIAKRLLDDPRLGALPKILIGDSGNFPELARFYYRNVIRRVLALISGLLERGKQAGEFRADLDTSAAAPLVMAPLLMGALWKLVFERHAPGELGLERMLDLHVETFLRGISARNGGNHAVAD